MVAPIQSFPGSETNPGQVFFGHERTGWWVDETTDDDEWVFSVFGLEIFRLTAAGLMYKGKYSRPIQNEVPAGLINSSNVTYTLANTPNAVPALYLAGLRLTPTTDFTITGLTITMTAAPTTGAKFLADYFY
jgi:hypothetical protein